DPETVVGDRVTALKTLRRDLGAHLAAGLGAAHTPLGKKPNPPAVVVGSDAPYVVASSYCLDDVGFSVALIAPPGDLDAVADALDDMVDQVRATLRTTSPAGFKYRFVEVGGLIQYQHGDLTWPAVTASVHFDRESP
ncbi:MAG TPA: hypothetical protein VGK49_04505, partial [Ilumatobacteraceae bacterium]